uniref:Ubiquitin-associated domain-containing protein 2-like n=1 Tax=Rhizophora mucronata TaxID=61149 RepID=A0A2P2MWB2_RHIMU
MLVLYLQHFWLFLHVHSQKVAKKAVRGMQQQSQGTLPFGCQTDSGDTRNQQGCHISLARWIFSRMIRKAEDQLDI